VALFSTVSAPFRSDAVPRGPPVSPVAQRLDELLLVHRRTALNVQFPGPVAEFVDGPLLVGVGLPALATDLAAPLLGRRISDARGLLLARPVVAQRFV